ncbi:MAG: CPBP family intramembrane metalloprotease [Planctomycetales bacterium]|nr:CPBP family intramembrane metalloprotease [Planctomycetales bacterium]
MPAVVGNSNYWRESSRPLPSLLFIAPMILVYELGILLLGPQAARNGADVWLRSGLESLGFAQHFLLPMLTCGLLLAWHHHRRERWTVDTTVIGGMAVESAAFGVLLLLAAKAISLVVATPAAFELSRSPWTSPGLGRVIGYLGAGIYEELMFRLLLLPPAMAGLAALGLGRRWSCWWAGLATSLLFAAAHYQVDLELFGTAVHWYGEPFRAGTFLFRVLAGGFFSALFLLRGFGIAAGAHALYDILVVLL